MAQTTIQRNDALRFGSAVLEIGPDFLTLTNVGAIRDLVFTHKGETVEILFDNTDSVKFFKNGLKGSFGFLLAEIDMTVLEQLEEGQLNLSLVAGALVSNAIQVFADGAWLEDQFLEIENQNGDLSTVVINSVTGSVDGLLVADDDYRIVEDGSGKTGIVMDLAGAVLTTESQSLTIDYDYTPNASKNITFNDFGQKTEYVARITNTNNNGDRLIIDLSGVTNINPLSFPLLSDDADDVSTMELELDGNIDSIIDEQSTT